MYKAKYPCAYKKCGRGNTVEWGLCYHHGATYNSYKKRHPEITIEEYFKKVYTPTGPKKNPRKPKVPYLRILK